MHETYQLDLDTMLSTLARRQLSGTLMADVLRGRLRKETWHIEMTLQRGEVATCWLSQRQTRITDEEALQMIRQLGVIPWTFITAITSPSMSGIQNQTVGRTGAVPSQLVSLPASELTRLPRPHFQVYAYVDGRRNIASIAQLLRATPAQIETVLRDLQTWKLISIE